jgi:adenylate kinase family enzyme
MHVHITGASGSGATTLGAALARELSLCHTDADNYYWLPTSPPFKEKRSTAERLALLCRDLHSEPGLVLSGSVYGWGSEIEDAFDLVVFLYLPASVRVERLRRREIERCGTADPAFLEWAAQYDEGPSEGRSLAKHNAWLAQRTCPVLRLEQDQTVAERVARVRQALPTPPARGAA